jgi:hypothetical protein
MNKYLDIIQATRQHTDQLFVQWAGALVSGTGRSGVIRSVKDHNHKTEDMYAVAYISVWFFVATWLVRKLTIEPLARYYLPRVTGDKRKLESRTAKFGQSAMEGLTYAAFSYFGYVIVLQQEWFLPADRWFGDLHDNSLPDSQESHYNIDTALTFYVLSYLGRYFAAVLSLFLEAKRKDFWQMFVHHVSTCFLVWTCYFKPYVRIGAVIMVLLDPADVPLHVAKLLKYMSSDSKGKTINIPTNNVCDASFGIFAITFALMRIVCYPYVVYKASTGWDFERLPKAVVIGIGLLYVLFALQAYWFYLISRMVIKVLSGGEVEDSRSDSEEDDDDDEKEKND